jgi:hypothetical protein
LVSDAFGLAATASDFVRESLVLVAISLTITEIEQYKQNDLMEE